MTASTAKSPARSRSNKNRQASLPFPPSLKHLQVHSLRFSTRRTSDPLIRGPSQFLPKAAAIFAYLNNPQSPATFVRTPDRSENSRPLHRAMNRSSRPQSLTPTPDPFDSPGHHQPRILDAP